MDIKNSKGRIRKSIWLPTLLSLYFICMAIAFGPELIRKGEILRFSLVSAVEIVIILLVFLFYRRREKNINK